MLSCHSSITTSTPPTMLGHHYRTSTFLFHRIRPSKLRPVLFDPVSPKFKVSSSLGNAIAAAASAASSPSFAAHAAVTSTITQVAVTAVAIASGACLSTKVDFLWPKSEEQPSSLILEGVDVTGYPIFNDLKVRKAISFAKKAHHGQSRKTGDPYLTHCIHTGRILAALAPSSGQRAVDTVVAGILHDVMDDTSECVLSVREAFGDEVAALVSGVSRLSYVNQLLRRHRRMNTSQTSLTNDEANNLRVMLLGMVDDPRVVLIKLADRLHNMRTLHALPLSKAQAVAQETLVIWCSLASRLGLWALKAELEDLCFAVLQPHIFCQMRAELASMWSPCKRMGNPKRLFLKDSVLAALDEGTPVSGSVEIDEDDDMSMKDLLEAVLPFDLLSDRNKRISFLGNLTKYRNNQRKDKIIRDAGIAFASLSVCEEALERELFISTSYVPGMEVTLSSRLKSLYSIYSKMKRKDVGISKVYDARALRIIVGDKDGTLHGDAVTCCYSILDLVHRLWAPIDGEFDDYIVNPKPSGYQSLHTAVLGPDNSPLEVQIRTQRMHEYAEHGLAAHWLYKEMESTSVSARNADGFDTQESVSSKDADEQTSVEDQDLCFKYSCLKAGHPVLRVEGSHLLAAVIISVNKNGKELLVAVSFWLGASEAVAERRTSFQLKRWEAYARLYKKVCDEWWFEPGHGDWCTCLEKYTLCRDGIYHKQDQFDRLLPTYIQVIQLTDKEESEYWTVVSAVFDGGDVDSITSTSEKLTAGMMTSKESNINNKVRLLRAMLQWEEQLCSQVGVKGISGSLKFQSRRSTLDFGQFGEVAIVCWPYGDIMRLNAGSTAADAARRAGLEGKLVLVNGHLVLPSTELKDGDVVEVRL